MSSFPRRSSSASIVEWSLETPDFDVEQLVPKNVGGPRQPLDFLSGEEADRENLPDRLRGAPRRFRGNLGLREREPRMIEEGAAGGGQLHAVHAAGQERNADFVFEIADLAAQRRLRRVQPFSSAASVRLPSSATATK